MNTSLHACIARVLAFTFLSVALQAPAQQHGHAEDTSLKTQGNEIAAGVVAVSVAVGVGVSLAVYYGVRHAHRITGCVSGDSASSLSLLNHGDNQSYALVGKVEGIHPGDRITVHGKKKNAAPNGPPQFLVDNIVRDFGPCPAAK